MSQISPLWVFVSSFAVAGFAGLAALLRSGDNLTVMKVASAASNSGLLGLGISLLWYSSFIENVYGLIGVCLLAGLGGTPTINFVLDACKKLMSIRFGVSEGEKKP